MRNNQKNGDNYTDSEIGLRASNKKQKLCAATSFSTPKIDPGKKTKMVNKFSNIQTSECSDEYTSSLSPSDTASSSESSVKSCLDSAENNLGHNSTITLKLNAMEETFLDGLPNKKLNKEQLTHKKTGNKANISEVIDRLNMNLPPLKKSFSPVKDEKPSEIKSEFSSKKFNQESEMDPLDLKLESSSFLYPDNPSKAFGKCLKKSLSAPCSPNGSSPNISGQSDDQSSYKCTFCNIVFDEYPLYSIHAGMHSSSNPWKCNVCHQVCSNKIDFAVHILHLNSHFTR
jgi:hypothetical protein